MRDRESRASAGISTWGISGQDPGDARPGGCLGDQELQRLGGTPSELAAQACVIVCVCVCVHGREGVMLGVCMRVCTQA